MRLLNKTCLGIGALALIHISPAFVGGNDGSAYKDLIDKWGKIFDARYAPPRRQRQKRKT